MRLICGLFFGFFMFANVARADEYMAVTPSGAAEVIFAEAPDTVVGLISAKCIDAKWTVVSSSSTVVVCESPLSTGQSILGQVLLGNSYSTPPRRFFRFNVALVSRLSRVQASGWMELQMAFGQVKRTDFSGPEFQNSIMSFMIAAGGHFPVGTRFPNHAALGVQGDDVRDGKFTNLRVTQVETGGPAHDAGLQVGDIVTKIAGRRFKDMGDYLDATAKAAKTEIYEVEFVRGGVTKRVSVRRAFRPTISESIEPVAEQNSELSISRSGSVADELLKLSKLKEQGVITEAEFEAQKKKLLGM